MVIKHGNVSYNIVIGFKLSSDVALPKYTNPYFFPKICPEVLS
jgi:hypothetical protein